MKEKMERERKNDPAKFFLQACEFFLKCIMIIPFTLFKKVGEPLVSMLI